MKSKRDGERESNLERQTKGGQKADQKKGPSFQTTFSIWEADFVPVVFSERRTKRRSSGNEGIGRTLLGGDVSALVLLASTVPHSDAESCRVAVICARRSHVRPIKKPFNCMYL